MNIILDDVESPEFEPCTSPLLSPKTESGVKLIISRKKSGPITASFVDQNLKSEKQNIIRETSFNVDNHLIEDFGDLGKKGTPHRSRELKRLQENYVGSKDLSCEFNLYDCEPTRERRQSKYFESEGKLPGRSKSLNCPSSERGTRSRSRSRSTPKSMTKENPENHNINWAPPPKKGKDAFCWKCKKCGGLESCSRCERSFHLSCVKLNTSEKYLCPECISLDNFNKASLKAGKIPFLPQELNNLLSLAINRLQNNELFLPFKDESYMDNVEKKFIIKPITIKQLNDKVTKNSYKTTEEFATEVKWFLHNVLIIININGQNNQLFNAAKTLVKSVKFESIEIESCSECYYAANTKDNWFIGVCSKPHLIVWAKLKGYPFWPAKVMGISINHTVSVRFFGDHDRAQIPIKDCYLYSKDFPCPGGKKNNRSNLQNCIKEVEIHIENLKAKYGIFEYAPQKTPYDPNKEIEQLNFMLPKYKEFMEKQTTKPNTGLQFKIYKTSDNNLSMTKIQNLDNHITSTITEKSPIEVQKKPNYDTVPTRVVLKRRPSGEYVVENKRGRQEENSLNEKVPMQSTNSIVAEIMKKNQGVTITKIPKVLERSKTVEESITAPPLNPFVIKTEPVDEDEIIPVETTEHQQPVINNEVDRENASITNVSIVKQETTESTQKTTTSSGPIQQSTPIRAPSEPVTNFEMSSSMVCIPLATSSSESVSQPNQTPAPQVRDISTSASPIEDNVQKMAAVFRSVLLDTYNEKDALIMNLRLEFENEKKELMKTIKQKNLEIKDLVQSFEKTKGDIRRECELAIDATKRKQWCVKCWKEAQLYCCWNTSYCSFDCQRKHWAEHCPSCNNLELPKNPVNHIIKTDAASSSNYLRSTPIVSSKRKSGNINNDRFTHKTDFRKLNINKSSDSFSPNSSPIIRHHKSIPFLKKV